MMAHMRFLTGKGFRKVLALGLASLVASHAIVAQETGDDPLLLKTAIDVTAEYHYRSAEVLIEDSTVKNGIDVTRNFLAPPPFASINWDVGRRQGLAIGAGAEIRRQSDDTVSSFLFPSSNLIPIGWSGNPVALENQVLTRGALYWRSPALDVTLGRDKIDLDDGIKGSLYPSPRLPFIDAFKTKARLGPLSMDWFIASERADYSWDGQSINPNLGVNLITYPDGLYGFMDAANPTMVIEELQRFTWDFKRLRLGIAGHEMYARRNNYFTVIDFIPVMAWHQTKIYSNNLTLYLDASWWPVDGLRVSGIVGVDEINASGAGVSDSGSPTVPAGVVSVDYKGSLASGAFELYAEGGYTHYLWGNFDGSNNTPGDVDPLERAVYYYYSDEGTIYLPLTSPYGPGATWARMEGQWEIPQAGVRLGLDLLLLSKIKLANLVSTTVLTPDAAGASDAERTLFFQAALSASWTLGDFELYAKPSLLARDGSWWFEAAIGGAYHFRRATALDAMRP
jgi:hypothetical protein